MRSWVRWLGCTAAIALANCGDRSEDFDAGFDLMAPASIDDHIVLIDRERDEAHLFRVSRAEPDPGPLTAALPKNPILFERRQGDGESELLVLCAGQPDTGEDDPERAALAVVDRSGVDRVYRFDSRFNAMNQSDDGRYAFLFFDEQARSEVGSLLFNPNEVALIDLTQGPSEGNPSLRTLRSFGGAPKSVVFSPEMPFGGEPRRLAVVLFQSDVALLDLSHLDRPEFTVGLTSSRTQSIGLSQVLFDDDEPEIYLRGSGSNDVFVISLSESNGASENDFVPFINQLGAGERPNDMVLFEERSGEDPGTRLLVAAPGRNEALVVNADSNEVTSIQLEQAADRILLFEAASPNEDEVKERALLYQQNGNVVTFLDLDGVEDARGRNAEALSLSQAYRRLIALEDGLVLLVHANSGLSLLDLAERTVAPINSSLNLLSAVPAEDKLWVAPPGQDRLGFLELENLDFHPGEVRLDAPIEQMIPVASEQRPRIVVTHGSSVGYLSVIDAQDPTNLDKAYSLRGFLLHDVLGAP